MYAVKVIYWHFVRVYAVKVVYWHCTSKSLCGSEKGTWIRHFDDIRGFFVSVVVSVNPKNSCVPVVIYRFPSFQPVWVRCLKCRLICTEFWAHIQIIVLIGPLQPEPEPHSNTHTHTHIHTYIHTYTHTHTYIHQTHTRTYTLTQTHKHTNTHKHTHTHTHTNTHTYIYIYIYMSGSWVG